MNAQQTQPTLRRQNRWGGSAGASGVNLHASVTAIAAVNLLAQRPLSWLKDLERDVPIEIWCETGGSGDDLRLVLETGHIVEAQVKKGLHRGAELWKALEALAHGVHTREISYGVLVLDPDASGKIRNDLARGLKRMGAGRTDDLNEISSEFFDRLTSANIPVESVCRKLRIVVVHCSDQDSVSFEVAIGELRRICIGSIHTSVIFEKLERSASALIENRGRWTRESIEAVLTSTGAAINRSIEPAFPVTSGFAWTYIDAATSCRGLIEPFRQHYLIGNSHSKSAFGGREGEFESLNRWLSDPTSPNRFLLHGPTARGKSALLVHWVEQYANDATWSVVFVPVSIRFRTDKPAVYYCLLATQLAQVLHQSLPVPTGDLEAHYAGVCSDLLQLAARKELQLLVVVDGLDESRVMKFGGFIVPTVLPKGIKVLFSAREEAGDQGATGWLRRLAWTTRGMAITHRLAILEPKAVVPILESVGIPSNQISDSLIERLMELSEGEPLLLSLYAEDLAAIVLEGEVITSDSLVGLEPGFIAYFARAFKDSVDGSVIGDAQNAALAVLAMAMAPIQGQHLNELACQISGASKPLVKESFIDPFKRFIAGNGSSASGYVLNHPKLAEYLKEDHFDSNALADVEQVFLEWGRRVASTLKLAPSALVADYALQRFVDHLKRSELIQLDDVELVLTDGWRQAWFRLEHDYSGYADSLATLSRAMPSLPEHSELSRAIYLKLRIALHVSSVKSQRSNFSPDLLELAVREEVMTVGQANRVAQLHAPQARASYWLALAPHLSPDEIAELLVQIESVDDLLSRMMQLAQLSPHLSPPLRRDVAKEVMRWLNDECPTLERPGVVGCLAHALEDLDLEALIEDEMAFASDPLSRAGPLRRPQPPGTTTLSQLMGEGKSETDALPDSAIPVLALVSVLDELQQRNMCSCAERMLAWCQSMIDKSQDVFLRVKAITEVAQRVGPDKLLAQRTRVLPLAQQMFQARSAEVATGGGHQARYLLGHTVTALAILEVLEIGSLSGETYRTRLNAILQPFMGQSYEQVDALREILPLVKSDFKTDVAKLAFEVVCNMSSANNRVHALVRLCRHLPSFEKRIAIEKALSDAPRIEDEYSRAKALIGLFAQLPNAVKNSDIDRLYEYVARVPFAVHKLSLLLQLADQMPGANGRYASEAISLMVQSHDVASRDAAMLRELHRFPEDVRSNLVGQCLARLLLLCQRGISGGITNLSFAASYAPDFWRREDLAQAREIARNAKKYDRASLLVNLAPIALKMGDQSFFDDAFDEALTFDNSSQTIAFLSNLCKYLKPNDNRRKLLVEKWLQNAQSKSQNFEALIDCFKIFLEEEQRVLWPVFLASARTGEWSHRHLTMLSDLASTPVERSKLRAEVDDSWRNAAHKSRLTQANHIVVSSENKAIKLEALQLVLENFEAERAFLLSSIEMVSSIFPSLGGSDLVLNAMKAIYECGEWWP